MRERIMRLSRGIVDAETPKLFLEPAKVEETLGSDTVYKRELYLASENNLYIKGLAYSSHSRVRILKSAFGGLRNHIVYEVDTSWCENGDLIRGNFTLVTNSGVRPCPVNPEDDGRLCGAGKKIYGSGAATYGVPGFYGSAVL